MDRKMAMAVDIGHSLYESLKDFNNEKVMQMGKAYLANARINYCSSGSSSTSPSNRSSESGSTSSEQLIETVIRVAIPNDDEGSSIDEDIAFLMKKLRIRDKPQSNVLPMLKSVAVRPTSLDLRGPPRKKYKFSLPSPVPVEPTSAFNFFVYPSYFPRSLNYNVVFFVLESRNHRIKFNPEKFCVQFIEAGPYRISVCLKKSGYQHVDGSPFMMMLHDFNIKFEIARRIHPPPMKKLHTFGSCKFWGLAVSFANDLIYVTQDHDILVLAVCPDGFLFHSRIGAVPWKEFPGGIQPAGIACDDINHRLLVTDKANHCIIAFSYFGQFLNRFGTKGRENGEFNFPWGIAVSPNGEYVAVADSKNHRIQIFSKNFEFIRKFSVYENDPIHYKQDLDLPRGIAFNFANTKIYVSDILGNKIVEFDIGLTYEKIISNNVFSGPQGIQMEFYGNLVVCDYRHNTIAVMDTQGIIIRAINRSTFKEVGDIERPFDVAICGSGIIVFIDKCGDRLAIV